MKITEAVNCFLEDRKSFCVEESVSYYTSTLLQFDFWCQKAQIYEVEDVDERVLKAYLVYLRERKCKATTCHNYFRSIYSMLHYLEDEFDMQHVKKIKMPKLDPAIIMPLSASEVTQVINSIQGPFRIRNLLIVRLMLDCGLRSSEVRNLKKSDIINDSILIQKSKFNKSRVLPLPETVRGLIEQLPFTASPYLLTEDSEPLTKDVLRNFFTRLKKRSGVQRIHAHLLRHTFATSYMYFYKNLEYLRLYMGHESYEVTQNYVQLSSQCLLTDYDIYRIPDCYK